MKTQHMLIKALKKSELSQTKLAQIIGIQQPTLSAWYAGKTEISDEHYIKIAKLAGVDPALVLICKHQNKAGPEAAKVWEQITDALRKQQRNTEDWNGVERRRFSKTCKADVTPGQRPDILTTGAGYQRISRPIPKKTER
jgi:plasmid maintenance system antidote protein VapI